MSFLCIKCGACCRHIMHIDALASFDQGNGVCCHLNADNSCGIYYNRPEICCVDVMYEKYFSQAFSREEFYIFNKAACRHLQKSVKNKNR